MSRVSSPLRYPGGKSSMFDLVRGLVRLNNLECGHYAEPYAGGCGLALEMLFNGVAAEIHVNDIDPAIWSFWHCVLNRTEELVDRVLETPVTIDEWYKQRATYRAQRKKHTLALGFSAFYLNRTNRSGVIKGAGVIGGLEQTGNYRMDCRFNRLDLAKRIIRIAKYRDRIHLTNDDALDFLKTSKSKLPKRTLMFIDPPYFNKGANLYTSFYEADDHDALAKLIVDYNLPWIVTYDDTPEIQKLYRKLRRFQFDIKYSLQEKRVGSEILIAAKGLKLPPELSNRQLSSSRNICTSEMASV
jgi:DNA adenine methylase